jgi:hypothetical protein
MNWANRGKAARSLAAAALTVALAGAAVAGPVVVRSTGPSARAYPAGRQLPDNAQLALKAGDTVVLLDSRGTRTLSGPGNFPAVGGSSRVSAAQTASRILANQTASERRGGAVRGGTATPTETRSPNLWFVDLSKSGTLCVADPSAVRVWRASGAQPAEVKISAATGSASITLPQGATVGDWPRSMPVTPGTEYTLTADGMAPAKIKFVTVPMPTSLEDTASQLIAKGCNTQLDLLIAQTSGAGTSG